MTSLDEPRLPSAGDPESSSWTDRGAVAGVALVSVITLVIVGAPAAAAGIGLVATFVALVGRQMFDVRCHPLVGRRDDLLLPRGSVPTADPSTARSGAISHGPRACVRSVDHRAPRRFECERSWTYLDLPIAALMLSILASVVGNPNRSNAFGPGVAKAIVFFATYLLLFYLIRSLFASHARLERLMRILVSCGAILGGFALIEVLTSYNIFSNLSVIPGLEYIPSAGGGTIDRAGSIRAYASAEHPIALGALLVLLLPLSFYLARGQRRWAVASVLLGVGVLASVSRTPIVMLLVVGATYFFYLPRQTLRLLPYLALIVVAIAVTLPSSASAMAESFFPKGGLLAEQSNTENDAPWGDTNGRDRPQHRHSRVVEERSCRRGLRHSTGRFPSDSPGDGRYSGVLDNQWLGLLLEVGAVGVAAWLWLLGRTFRHLHKIARTSEEYGFLAVSLTASTASFAVCMYFLDVLTFA